MRDGLERWWSVSKRRCRQRNGRKKLTREFRSLPAEFLLVANLENPAYVEAVLDGDLSSLPKSWPKRAGPPDRGPSGTLPSTPSTKAACLSD